MNKNICNKKMEDPVKRYAVKLKSKEAVDKLRRGGKNIRDILRKRCREQIREKRQELFDSQRLGLGNQEGFINDTFAEIVRKEFSDMSMMLTDNNKSLWESENFLTCDENITDIEEENKREHQFMLQVYEDMQQYDDDMINKIIDDMFNDEVICPICQIASIQESPEGLICQGCQLKLPPILSIGELAIAIEQRLNTHNNSCPEQAAFAALPENNTISLYLICDTCANFALIM